MTFFLSHLRLLLFLVWIFFLNFISRIIFSPLMPAIEDHLGIGHDEAGSLFFLISTGYCLMLLFSGYISSRLNHRRTIILSCVALGGAHLIVAFSPHLFMIRLGLILLGLAAGLYLPSGIAMVTSLVEAKDWGKAIAIHELAPNVAFVAAPFFADVLLRGLSWRGVLVVLGSTTVLSGIGFMRYGPRGVFHGQAPSARTLRTLLRKPSFWLMMGLFGLGIGASVGIYSILPLYLVAERGMGRAWANTLVGLSRISTIAVPLLSGWVTDRVGATQALRALFIGSGIATVSIGLAPGAWMVGAVFIQPLLAASFFPPAFATLVKLGSPEIKNIAVSLTMPISLLIGAGAIPAAIGAAGEMGSFSLGITAFGGMLFTGAVLAGFLKFVGGWEDLSRKR